MMYSTDAKESLQVWNSGLHIQVEISMEENQKWDKKFQTQFVYNGIHYYLSGIMSQEDFEEMVKKIHFRIGGRMKKYHV